MTDFVNTGTPIQRPRPATWSMIPPGYRVTRAGTIEQVSGVFSVDNSCGCPAIADPPSPEWIEKERAASYSPPLGHLGIAPNKP